MTAFLILLLVFLAIITGVYYPTWRKRRVLGKPFPEHWLNIVNRQLPFFDKLAKSEQRQLLDNIRLFLADKKFYGCGGLEMNDEIRITIAAEAGLLLLNRDTRVYPRLKHILVYPHAFRANHGHHNDDGTVGGDGPGLLGESWHYGKVILSWDDVEKGIRNFSDGHNVVLHEFSHQLDSEYGGTNGAPLLHTNSYATWASVLTKEFDDLNEDFANHHASVMDYYGATNPAEFFAVATETFFEKPEQMRQEHPELFTLFKAYYAVDPSAWQ